MTKKGKHFKKNGGLSNYSNDWISIRRALNELEKHGEESSENLLEILSSLKDNETWRKLNREEKKELISSLVNVDSYRKHTLIQDFK
jgi:hypothetical protein